MPPVNDYFLTSRRLGFRTWREADLDLAFDLWGDLRVTRLFDARGALSRQQVGDRLRREITIQKDHQVQYWPIFELSTGVHVGCAGLRPYDFPRIIFEIGFHIRPEHWRQGYAYEAAQAVMAYAFESMAIKALFAGHHPDNTASRRLLVKLGFGYTHDEYYPPTGRDHPSYLLLAVDRERPSQANKGGGR